MPMENKKANIDLAKEDLMINTEELLMHKFGTALIGYDPIDVDSFFDKIIHDYKLYEMLIEKNESIINEKNELIATQSEEINDLKAQLLNLNNELNKIK